MGARLEEQRHLGTGAEESQCERNDKRRRGFFMVQVGIRT
jgi:hypothetical protein